MTNGFYLKLVLTIIFGVSISFVLIESHNMFYIFFVAFATAIVVDDVVDQKLFEGEFE